jgi:hypothetical protein
MNGPKVTFRSPRGLRDPRSTWLYAGTSEYPTVLTAMVVSDNPFGADNQQGSRRCKSPDPSETTRRASTNLWMKI